MEPAQVQERVENHLKSLLIKHFDPQKADSIFTVEGEVRFLKTSTAVQIHDVKKMWEKNVSSQFSNVLILHF